MWVEELPNGKYKFVEWYSNEKNGKRKRVSVTLNSKSAQAKNKAQQLLNNKIAKKKTSIETKNLKFKDCFTEFFEFKTKRWAPSTTENMRSTYNVYIKTADLYDYYLDKITILDIQKLLDDIQYEQNKCAQITNRVKLLISGCFKYMSVYHDYTYNLEFSTLKVKPIKKRKSIQFIDSKDLPGELAKIRQELNEIQGDLIEVMILTGMRFGEVTALTIDDFNGSEITINKSIDSRSKRKAGTTKTPHSNRVIQTNDRINELINKNISLNRLRFGNEARLIFANRNNNPMLLTPINDKIKKVNKDYTSHTMRHTHISLLVENNFDIKYIMDRVGHADVKTTLEIYTHITKKQKEEAKAKLNKLVTF
ncbi:site-specific integrase [Facklamia sp. P12945]|uniref:site-specific integrase n=1 Tax=Facklamia sp. P12945 TaxID=3421950 RepID=UPI003D181722